MPETPTLIALISTRHEYWHLFSIYVPIGAGVFAVFFLAIVGATIRYRRRASPSRTAENNPLEATYTGVLVLVVAFLLYLTFTAEHRVDTVANQQSPSLVVQVTSAKWEWQFTYPRYDINLRSGTVGRQTLVVPTNQAIRFNLRSLDVIHGFWIPELRFKRDLIPGTTEFVTLTFTRAGLFPGQCAEFCGARHADMVFNVRALAPGAFARWAAAHRGAGA